MRRVWPGHRRVPRDVAASAALQRGERIIAAAPSADGSWLLATDRGLVVVTATGAERMQWHHIDRAAWRNDVLEVVAADRTRLRWLVPGGGALADAVRDRVTASIVVDRHLPLLGATGVRVVGRRVAGQDDLAWRLTFDPGLDPGDAQVRALADEHLAALRRQLGT